MKEKKFAIVPLKFLGILNKHKKARVKLTTQARESGAPSLTRTDDLSLTRRLLYQLSY